MTVCQFSVGGATIEHDGRATLDAVTAAIAVSGYDVRGAVEERRVLRFRYAEGRHDVEAMLVGADDGRRRVARVELKANVQAPATVHGTVDDGSAPLAGMGISFSSSLFGLAGSLVLGFLDLQTSQAQNAFYTDLEDWMTSMTELDHPITQLQASGMGVSGESMQDMLERLGTTMQSSSVR